MQKLCKEGEQTLSKFNPIPDGLFVVRSTDGGGAKNIPPPEIVLLDDPRGNHLAHL